MLRHFSYWETDSICFVPHADLIRGVGGAKRGAELGDSVIVFQANSRLWIGIERVDGGSGRLHLLDDSDRVRTFLYARGFDALREGVRIAGLGGGEPVGWSRIAPAKAAQAELTALRALRDAALRMRVSAPPITRRGRALARGVVRPPRAMPRSGR